MLLTHFYSTKQALPNTDEIVTAREIVNSRKPTKRKRDEAGDAPGDGNDDETGDEPVRKKGAVNNTSRVANEIALRALMMN